MNLFIEKYFRKIMILCYFQIHFIKFKNMMFIELKIEKKLKFENQLLAIKQKKIFFKMV